MSLSRWSAGLVSLALMCGSGAVSAQNKLEPTGPPGPTMKTLDEIPPTWSRTLPVNDTGDPCNSSRFKCVLATEDNPTGAAVLDRETGLVWEQAPTTLTLNWSEALLHCYDASVGGHKGWRLPTIEELTSLLSQVPGGNYSRLPLVNPFSIGGVLGHLFWSATADPTDATQALLMGFDPFATGRNLANGGKASVEEIWCVRGGHGHDGQ